MGHSQAALGRRRRRSHELATVRACDEPTDIAILRPRAEGHRPSAPPSVAEAITSGHGQCCGSSVRRFEMTIDITHLRKKKKLTSPSITQLGLGRLSLRGRCQPRAFSPIPAPAPAATATGARPDKPAPCRPGVGPQGRRRRASSRCSACLWGSSRLQPGVAQQRPGRGRGWPVDQRNSPTTRQTEPGRVLKPPPAVWSPSMGPRRPA